MGGAAEGANPTLSRLWSGEVEQVVDHGHSVRLYKEVVRLEAEQPLCMVRKHALSGPTRAPVMLVHGFAQNRYSWHTTVRSMSAWLAEQGWDVWNLELRGHGRSRQEGTWGAERFSDYVADVWTAAQALPARSFWVGHSLGGSAIYGAATLAQGSRRPRGVVGIGSPYSFGQANWALGLLGRITHALRHTVWMKRLQIRTNALGQIIAKLYGISDVAGYAFPISGWWPGSVEPELLDERLTRGFDWTSIRVWQEMSRWAATGVFDYDDTWVHTDHPLLVLLGDKDHLMPPDDGRVAYDRSGSSDRTMVLFDDWNHEVHWGHLDLVLGIHAPRFVWPTLDAWMRARS